MKFEIHYVLESNIGRMEAPNKENPVESVSLKAVLARLAEQLPDSFFNVRLVGVRVVEVDEFVPSGDAGEGTDWRCLGLGANRSDPGLQH